MGLVGSTQLDLRIKKIHVLSAPRQGAGLAFGDEARRRLAGRYARRAVHTRNQAVVYVYLNYTYYINILEDAYGC